MLLQGAGIPGGSLPPPGFATPQWEMLAEQWNAISPPAEPTVALGPETVVFGHDDPEAEDENSDKATVVDGVEFGWDNEHPRREVEVKPFKISWRPVTNGEFYDYWKGKGKEEVQMPASWIETEGEVKVRLKFSFRHSGSSHSTLPLGSHSVWAGGYETCRSLACPHVIRRPFEVCSGEGRAPPY